MWEIFSFFLIISILALSIQSSWSSSGSSSAHRSKVSLTVSKERKEKTGSRTGPLGGSSNTLNSHRSHTTTTIKEHV